MGNTGVHHQAANLLFIQYYTHNLLKLCSAGILVELGGQLQPHARAPWAVRVAPLRTLRAAAADPSARAGTTTGVC